LGVELPRKDFRSLKSACRANQTDFCALPLRRGQSKDRQICWRRDTLAAQAGEWFASCPSLGFDVQANAPTIRVANVGFFVSRATCSRSVRDFENAEFAEIAELRHSSGTPIFANLR